VENRVEQAIRRWLRADRALEVRYSDAVAVDSLHIGNSGNHHTLYLHPHHEALVREIQAEQ